MTKTHFRGKDHMGRDYEMVVEFKYLRQPFDPLKKPFERLQKFVEKWVDKALQWLKPFDDKPF